MIKKNDSPDPAVRGLAYVLSTALFCLALIAAAWGQQPEQSPIIGRWDITVQAANNRTYPSWLEVRLSGNRVLVGQFVGQGGSARPISRVEFANGQFKFSIPPQWDRRDVDLTMEGKVDGDHLSGTMNDNTGNKLTWTGNRAPLLHRTGEPKWGTPITLFNSKDLTGWKATGATNQWQAIDGILTSPKSGSNLITTATFTDFKLHIEFRYPKGSNSGVYLRGRYEVQVEDTAGEEPASDHLGGIYGFLTPNQDAAKPAGQWQTFDVVLVGRIVSVTLNGKSIICEQIIPGITGGALDSDEGAPGPIYLQGDHGPIEYRNIILTPAK
jgi:hypothetical protein